MILARVPGRLDSAIPDAWIQPASEKKVHDGKVVRTKAVAVFAVIEPNPRFVGHLQVSVTHMALDGWRDMEKEAAHYVAKGFDPLAWCLMQAAKGHLHTMANIRSMSHPVTRINEKGETENIYPTGH
jgi:hypothetical protein